MVDAYSTNPLRLLTPTPSTPSDPAAPPRVFVTGFGGGLVSGDRVELDVAVGDDASLLLSTQASTKVYHADESGTPAVQTLRARVGSGGRLALLPDPVVCFADSVYEQAQTIELADRAGLVLLDWFTAGRVAMDERWASRQYASRTRVRLAGREVVHDALTLDAAGGDRGKPFGRADAWTVVATVWLVGSAADVGRAWADRVRGSAIDRSMHVLGSAGVLADGAVVVGRFAGGSVEAVRSAINEAVRWLGAGWGIEPWARKW